MMRSIAAAVALLAAGAFAAPEPVDAAPRSKAKRAVASERPVKVRRAALPARSEGGWNMWPAGGYYRDRNNINHPNGRLNGQELFDSISDRSGSAGE